MTLRRLVLSYQRNAFDRSRSLRPGVFPEIRKSLAQHHRVEKYLIGPLRERRRHRVCGVAEQREPPLTRCAGNRMSKMRERRTGQVVVGQRREQSIDQVCPSGEIGPDHLDRPSRPDEVRRPRQVEPPLQIGSSSGPQANASVLADNDVRDVLLGDVGKGDQSLPAAPAGRLRRLRADDIANHRVQAVCTDQKIPFGEAAVVELDPRSVRVNRPLRLHDSCIGCDRPGNRRAAAREELDVAPSEQVRPTD